MPKDKLKPMRQRLKTEGAEYLESRVKFLAARIAMDNREIDAIKKEMRRRSDAGES